MARYDDVHPDDLDPETGRPYTGYSSPSLDTSFHEAEVEDDDPAEVPCIDRQGHRWTVSDENENVCYCSRCGVPEY